MKNNTVNVQFEYKIKEASLYCEKCQKIIYIEPHGTNQIKSFKCECGLEYIMPHHYANAIHNKQAKVIDSSIPKVKRKAKNYIATFWRGNSQHKDGGYETTREIRATSIELAEKRAEKEYTNPIYGSMSLIKVEEVIGEKKI